MQEAIRRLAAGHIMRLVTEAGSVDVCHLNGLVAMAVNQVSVIVVSQPQTWPNGCGVSVRMIVVQELQRLVRRERLVLGLNKFNNLVLEPREEILREVSRIS